MESVVALRSFQCTAGAVERAGMMSFSNVASPKLLSKIGSLGYATNTYRSATLVLCGKTSATDKATDASLTVKALKNATFPKGFEDLILDVCDETEIAEVKLKIGDFQMQLKRNLAPAKAPPAQEVSSASPPAPIAAVTKTASSSPPPKASSANSSSFVNIPKEKSAKLVALDASGATGYVLVSSPTVGSFHRGRTLKGKKQPPVCKQGDVIKEGQIIGYVDQFGTELPIKSDVGGELLKLLVDEGDGVGYGDPLIAVKP